MVFCFLGLGGGEPGPWEQWPLKQDSLQSDDQPTPSLENSANDGDDSEVEGGKVKEILPNPRRLKRLREFDDGSTDSEESPESEECLEAPKLFQSRQIPRLPRVPGRTIIKILLPLLLALEISAHVSQTQDLANLEVFSGVRSVANGFQHLNMPSAAFDIRDSPSRDLNAPQGFQGLFDLAWALCIDFMFDDRRS